MIDAPSLRLNLINFFIATSASAVLYAVHPGRPAIRPASRDSSFRAASACHVVIKSVRTSVKQASRVARMTPPANQPDWTARDRIYFFKPLVRRRRLIVGSGRLRQAGVEASRTFTFNDTYEKEFIWPKHG